jgi:hypothetical protein
LSRLLARKELEPDHAQVELSAVGGLDYPDWGRGDEAVVALEDCIAVATRPEHEGTVVIEVWDELPPDVAEATTHVHEGDLMLDGSEAQIGSYLAGEVEHVALGPGRHRVRVFVDQPGYAERVYFEVDRPSV